MIELGNDCEQCERVIYGDIKGVWNRNEKVISYLRGENKNTLEIIVNVCDELIRQEIDNEVEEVRIKNYENAQINED